MAMEKSDEAYQVFEQLDENQIADEIQGVYAKTLVYQFEGRDGRLVTGLSIKGVFEVAKSLVRHGYDITTEEAKITEETETEYKASCKAMFKAPNGHTLTTFGYSKANKFYGKVPSEFAYVQALSKAQRNALKTLIPEKFAAECVERFMQEKREGTVKKISPSKTTIENPVEKKIEKLVEKTPEKLFERPPTGSGVPTERRVVLRFLKDVPQFVGIDMKTYGPYKREDVGNVPELNVASLIQDGSAEKAVPQVGGEGSHLGEKTDETKGSEKGWTQDLVGNDNKKYGTIRLGEGEIEVLFAPPIPNVPSVIDNFLCNRILDTMAAKAKTEDKFIEYQLDEDETGVKAIHLIGDVVEKHAKDLINPICWAAKTALSKVPSTSQ